MHSAALLAMAGSASAAMIDVAVGAGGKLVYMPDSVTAAKGDVIRFKWPSSIGHNVVSSDYTKPCQPNGMIASPILMSQAQDFFVMVNSTDPMFFYCSVSDHCNEGMVLAVNPNSADTLAQYSSGAMSANIMQPSATPTGGILAAPSATPFGAAAGGSMSASASSAGSMSSGSASSARSSAMSSTRAATTGGSAAMTTGTAAAMSMTGAGNAAATAAPILAGALGVLAFAL